MRATELHRLARILREIAVEAAGNVGPDRVNASELAVFEDISRHPGTSMADITTRTGLAQSLVSRIVQSAAHQRAVTVTADERDRRRVRVKLSAATRRDMLARADNSIEHAVATHTPALTEHDRAALLHHLTAAAELLSR